MLLLLSVVVGACCCVVAVDVGVVGVNYCAAVDAVVAATVVGVVGVCVIAVVAVVDAVCDVAGVVGVGNVVAAPVGVFPHPIAIFQAVQSSQLTWVQSTPGSTCYVRHQQQSHLPRDTHAT